MKKVTIRMENYLYTFYKKIGEHAGGLKPEQVIADTLYKFAEELCANALNKGK